MGRPFSGRNIFESGDNKTATVRRHRPDYLMFIFMSLLMLIGLVIMFAIGPQRANVLNNAYGFDYSDSYFFIKQLVSIGMALFAFFMASIIPYQFFLKNANKLLLIGIGACLLLAVADLLNLGIAKETLGATRWFNLGPLGSLQPAEILKFSLLVFMAGFLGTKIKQGKINDFKETLMPLAVVLGISMFFVIVIQKDFGTGVSIFGIVMAMLVLGKLSIKNCLKIFASILVLGCLLIFTSPHRVERVMTFIQGDSTSSSTSSDNNYHIEQAKIAIGTGGFLGVGIGNSVQSTGYLPEATNDSVFAIMGETFGFVGLISILAIFTGLLMRLLKLSDHMVDFRLKLIIAGVFGWFGIHVILNVASMIGLMPLTGITLPLLSFGGTSMMFIAAALGIVFQLSRYTVGSIKIKEDSHENSSSRRGVGRTRHSGRSSFTRN